MVSDIFLLIATAPLLFLTVTLWFQGLCRLLRYKTAAGRVTGYRWDEDCYWPKFEFEIESGETVSCVSDSGRGVKEYGVGAEVRVLYNPNNPSIATTRSFWSMWAAPVGSTVITGVFLFFTIKAWAKRFGI